MHSSSDVATSRHFRVGRRSSFEIVHLEPENHNIGFRGEMAIAMSYPLRFPTQSELDLRNIEEKNPTSVLSALVVTVSN